MEQLPDLVRVFRIIFWLLAGLGQAADILKDNGASVVKTWGNKAMTGTDYFLFGDSHWSRNCDFDFYTESPNNFYYHPWLWLQHANWVDQHNWEIQTYAGLVVEMDSPRIIASVFVQAPY